MKKTIIAGAISGLLATGMMLYSCQKEQQTGNPANTQNEYQVSASNNLLAFKTVEDYKAIADNPSAEAKAKFTDHVSRMNDFTPMSKLTATETRGTDYEDIDNDFLKGILNKDAAVQIGDYIYKISVKKGKVFVLHKSDISNYKDVVAGNTGNVKVKAFSINDEVLELTNNKNTLRGGGTNGTMDVPEDCLDCPGGGGSGGTTCNETGIGERHVPVNTSQYYLLFSNTQKIFFKEISMHFQKYGIYFDLYSVMEANPDYLKGQCDYLLDWKTYYHVKCGNTVGNPFPSYYGTQTRSNPPINGMRFKYQSYQGSKNLNELRIQCRWGVRIYMPGNKIEEQFIPWHEIRANC